MPAQADAPRGRPLAVAGEQGTLAKLARMSFARFVNRAREGILPSATPPYRMMWHLAPVEWHRTGSLPHILSLQELRKKLLASHRALM
jgi:hypothetical protein